MRTAARSKWWPVLVATPLYLVSCTFAVGGLASARTSGDVDQYERYARLVLDGRIPYADFYVDYPPGAFPAWILPALVADDDYLTAFKLEMAVVGLLAMFTMAWILDRLGTSGRRSVVALCAVAVSPLALGHPFLNRFDPWPALLVVLALAAVLAARDRLTGALLSAGFAVKAYAVVVAPMAAVWIARLRGRLALTAAVVSGVLVGIAAFGPFATLGLGGIGNTYQTQATRHLQVESLAASPFLVADELGLLEVRTALLPPGSIDLVGTGPDVAAAVTSLLQLALVLLVAFVYWRRPDRDGRLVAAFAASVAAFVAFGKVLSPQFLVWLVFLVPLVGGRRGLAATALLLCALGLTQLELEGYESLRPEGWAVWVLLARNLTLVALFGVLLHAVSDEGRRIERGSRS